MYAAVLRLVTSKINVIVVNVCKSELLLGNLNFAADHTQNLLNGLLMEEVMYIVRGTFLINDSKLS